MKNVSAATQKSFRFFNDMRQGCKSLIEKVIKATFLLGALLLSTSIFSQPTITSFSPLSAYPGSTLTIQGKGFGSTPAGNVVTIGGEQATVLSASSTKLTVRIPKGLNDQPVTVTAGNRTGLSAVPFNARFKGGFVAPGTFATSVALSPDVYGERFGAVTYDDLDADGKLDLFVSADVASESFLANRTWAVFRNTSIPGQISFAPEIPYRRSALADYGDVFLVDVDCDAKKDVIFVSDNSEMVIYLNNSTPGNISFQDGVKFAKPPSLSGTWLYFADLNADGKQDLYFGNGVFVKNTSLKGNVSFSEEMQIPSDVQPVYFYDFNNDGKTDIYGYVQSGHGAQSPAVAVNTSSNGNASYAEPQGVYDQSYYSLAGIADVNKDGKLDILLNGRYPPDFYYYSLNASAGTSMIFMEPQQFQLSKVSLYKQSTDVDGDGRVDLVGQSDSANGIVTFKNTYAGNKIVFGQPVKLPEMDFEFPTFADVDGDGKTDITYVQSDGPLSHVRILRNQADTATGAPVITSFTPTSGTTNDTVTIKGNNFNGTTKISFGNTPVASFAVNSNTQIKAVVGDGNTGAVEVTNNSGTASKARFTYSRDTSVKAVTMAPALFCENTIIYINAHVNNVNQFGTLIYYTWYKNGIRQGEKTQYYDLKTLKNNDSVWVVVRFSNKPAAKQFKSNVLRFKVNPVEKPVVRIVPNKGTTVCKGLPVTFKASVTNGNFMQVYQWQKNNMPVGDSTDTYIDDSLQNNDVITCNIVQAQLCTILPASASVKMKVIDGKPEKPSSIIGPDVVAASQKNLIFSVKPVSGAAYYRWLIPKDASFVSSSNTDSVMVNWTNTTAKISVAAGNVCGYSEVVTKTVMVETTGSRIAQTDANSSFTNKQELLRVYPNPASSNVAVELSGAVEGASVIELRDAGGRTLITKKIQSQKGALITSLNIARFAPGTYYIVVIDKNNNAKSSRLMIGR